MEFSHHIFFLALLLPLVACTNPIYQHCVQNFTGNSILQDNINKTIHNMIELAPSSGYAVLVIGNSNDMVYGLTRCRGDIGPKACSDCIIAASGDLQANCSNKSASRIWYDLCFMRYETTNFFGTIDNSDRRGWGSSKEAEDPIKFSLAVQQLLNWVKTSATTRSNKFGMGKRNFNSNESITIYGMAQCTADLEDNTCMKCLDELTIIMIKNCTTKKGCLYMSSSCYLRFEVENFLLATTIPTYAEVDAPSPSPSAIA